MIIDVGYWTRILKNILMLGISLILIFLAFKLAVFYMPFLIGFIISLLVEPLIRMIVKKSKIERKKVAILVLVVIFGIILGLLAWGIVSLITESSNLLQGFNGYIEMMYEKVKEYIGAIKDGNTKFPAEIVSIIENSTDKIVAFVSEYISNFLTKVTQIISEIPVIGIYVFITVLATYFICTDKMYIRDAIEHQLPQRWAKKIGVHSSDIIKALGNYLKAEAILILISFGIVLVGLYVLKIIGLNVPYPFLSALGIGFVDALPILRFRNNNDTMGSNSSIKRRPKIRNSNNNNIRNNTNSKATSRTKNSKQQNRNTPNIYINRNVHRVQNNRSTRTIRRTNSANHTKKHLQCKHRKWNNKKYIHVTLDF